jgi:hypothetical protein
MTISTDFVFNYTILYYTDVSHSFLPSQQFHNLEPNKTKKDGEEKEAATELSDNLQKRMTNAMSEIKQRHSNGTSQADDADKAPTGSAYHAAAQMKKSKENEAKSRAEEVQRLKAMKSEADAIYRNQKGQGGPEDHDDEGSKDDGEEDSEDEYDQWLNDDTELEAIRQRRMQQMRAQQTKVAHHKSLGHGEVRTIAQDEFLPECTGGSEWIAVHFYHKEFERCKILDHHLKAIAPFHLECKFLRIDAEMSPFFVDKLNIKTLPTLMVFREGKAVDKLMGFQDLAIDASDPDKWHTGRLQQWLAGTGAIKYTIPTEEIKEEMRRMGITPKGTVWSGTRGSGFRSGAYDDSDDEE